MRRNSLAAKERVFGLAAVASNGLIQNTVASLLAEVPDAQACRRGSNPPIFSRHPSSQRKGRRASMVGQFIMSLDPNRENILQQATKLLKAKFRVLDSYRRVKVALKALQDHYGACKGSPNLISRYQKMDKMVTDVSSQVFLYRFSESFMKAQNLKNKIEIETK